MSAEKKREATYSDTINRIEPYVALIDRDAALASIAISLKRIADELTQNKDRLGIVDTLFEVNGR